ncbi:MAG: glycosyltransferase family A protein [Thermoplasmata archaeon]|nr:glycosyltransferase family A protein [Thermoplasmata archaeon]
MKISTIISTYSMDRLKDTEEAIDSVLMQTHFDKEILVVMGDNEELFRCLDLKFGNRIKLIVCKTKGLSAARNTGIENSSGEIVAFMDDDALADPYWLESISKIFEAEPKTGAVTGTIEPLWMGKNSDWLPEQLFWTVSCTYMEIPDGSLVMNLIGTNMAFQREIFNQGFKFSEKLGAKEKWNLKNDAWVQTCNLVGEERDFCIRLIEKGWYIRFSSGAKVYHRVYGYRITLKNLMKRGYWEGFSKGLLAKYHTNSDVLATERDFLMHIAKSLALTGRGRGTVRIRQVWSILLTSGAVLCGFFHFKISGHQKFME